MHDDVFLILKNLTSERPIALMPTLIRWWEALRAPEVKWQQKYRVEWDATEWSKRRSSTNRMGNIDGDEKIQWQRKKVKVRQRWFWTWRRHRSGSVSLWSGLGQRTSQERSCERCAGISSTRGVYTSKDVWQSRSRPSRPSCQDSKWSCLLLRRVLQDSLSEVTKNYPPLKLRVFVHDITARF